ncbi:uncharacterized protein LOC118774100 [Megalops cyprinoides]|uniref:uncharacterized protein LOC118774100 n=1 Tax=Megalops cyprinoides TaxID=118141 RepID=UPI00186444B6|nr:uncharacterized protein LOC118774100 [Megalops cyprinoides]
MVREALLTFHGSEGERERAEVGEEEGEACSVLGDAGGFPLPPPSSSPPRSPAAPGPGTPTAPLDAFFRRLGSLFHLSSKAEPASEELQQAEAAAPVPHPDPTGMTRVPEGSREPCDLSGRRLGEADADRPRQEGRGTDAEQGEGGRGGESESGELPHMPADPESVSGAQTPEEHAHPDLQGPQHLVLNEAAGEEGDIACGAGAADEQAEGEASEEQRRRLALSCPPVVTYGTYRGLREIKKMRRRNRVQVDSPILEGEEVQQSAGDVVDVNSPPGQGARTDVRAADCQGAAALSVSECASCNQKGAQASVRDGDFVAPTRPGLGSIPVIIASENGQSQSALPQEQEPDLASTGSQTTDSHPGAVSAASFLSAAEQDSSDKQTVPAEGGGEAGQSPSGSSAEKATQAMAETVTKDTKAGAEPAETLSPREGSAGSPSETGDVTLSAVGCARGTAGAHQPAAPSGAAALSRRHGCQSARCSISPSAMQEAEDSEGPMPGEWAVGVQEYVPAAGEGEGEGEWIEAEGDPVEDTGPDEEALQYESKLMVDNILKSALAALQKIESFERENGTFPNAKEASSPVLPEKDNNTDSYLNPAYRQQESLTEQGEGCYLAVEQTQGLSGTLMEGNRSTLSSGYESIVGSDTDIRNNPGFNTDPSSLSTPISLSDQGQDEQCSTERPQAFLPSEIHSSSRGDWTSCYKQEMDPALNSNTKSCITTQKNKSVTLSGGSMEADGDEVVQKSNDVSKLLESVAVNKDDTQVDHIEGENQFSMEISLEARGQAMSKSLNLAKDTTESNRQSQSLNSSSRSTVASQQQDTFQSDTMKLKADLEKPNNFNGINNGNPSFMQVEGNAVDATTFHRETQITDAVQPSRAQHMKKIDEDRIQSNLSEPFQNSEEVPEVPVKLGITKDESGVGPTGGNEVLQDSSEAGVNSHDRKICQTDQNGTGDVPALLETTGAGDQSFALVEGYLATVIEDDSGGEEDNGHIEPGSVHTNSKGEHPEDSEKPVHRTLTLALDPDTQQWSAVKAYRCHVLAEEPRTSEALRRVVGAAVHDDVSSRAPGLAAPGKKVHPDLPLNVGRGEPPGPHLHRFHELDFAIINEEEEADAVFINDTGTMLSPTTRRGKIYPFSLSPIFEEECGREEASMEDLQEPPVTEEDLRSVEQQASSILSLLQSVSERLQSSAFADAYEDSSEDLSPPLRPPLWGCLSDQAEEDGYADDKDRSTLAHQQNDNQEGSPEHLAVTDEAGSFSSSDHPAGSTRVACLLLEDDQVPSTVPDSTAVSSTPFYEYLKSARSSLPALDTDNKQPHSQANLCQSGGTAVLTQTNVIGKSSGKVSPRPSQMHIYEGVTFSGERREIHADVEDATGMAFPNGASVRVLRGCWLLYREPGFRGPCVVLEEGEKVLSHAGDLGHPGSSSSAIKIGSIRRAVKDNGPPEIQIHRRGAQGGTLEHLGSAVDGLEARGAVHLPSLSVKSGCWVAYDSAGFRGNYTVLEADGSQTLGPGGAPVVCVRSLRPLVMGGLKVQRPLDPRMEVYEEPSFGGQSSQLGDNTPSLGALQGLRGAASLRVLGGVWVGYSREGYKGRQYLLEEGEYGDCLQLGGSDRVLLSFRYLQADFMEPSVSLLGGPDSPDAAETDIVDSDVPELGRIRPTGGTASIRVKNGVWVAYSEPSFCGQQHILEKGTHPGDLEWSDCRGPAASLRPVRLDLWGSGEPKFLLRAYSQPHYQGSSEEYETEVSDCGSILPKSFKVIRGSWLLFDEEGCAGNQFVLGEGLYPDLISCGCVTTSIRSLKPIPYSFSDPSISLFSLQSFEGLETVAVTPMETMNNFFTQSLRVNSGLWVVYEYAHFKGCQMLLHPGDFPAWGDRSGWDTIGSLHPLRQPKVYIQLKSRAQGSVLTADMIKDSSPPAKVSLSPDQGLDTQHWIFTGGLLKCKASKACLSVIGGKAIPGARVALWPEHGRTHQKWSLNENGTISSHLSHKLVLDVNGGTGFDKDHLVIREFTADQITQYWDIEM